MQIKCIHLVFFGIQETGISAQVPQKPRSILRLVSTLAGHTEKIDSISFSSSGDLIETSSKDGTVRFWDSKTGELKNIISGSERDEWLEKRYQAVRDKYEREKRIPTVFNGQLALAMNGEERALAISPDGQTILTSKLRESKKFFETPYYLSLWDRASGNLILTFEKLPAWMRNVHWSPNGKTIVLVGYGRYKVRLLDASSGRITATLPYSGCTSDSFFGGDNGCQTFLFNADSSLFLKATIPLKIWSSKTGKLLEQLNSARLPFEFSPVDKNLLVTAGKDETTALLWSVDAR